MTADQKASTPLHCPRCGGLMTRPAGSTLYWHADNNHPRCDITNLVEIPAGLSVQEATPVPLAQRDQQEAQPNPGDL